MKNKFFGLIGACVCGVMVLAGAVSCEKMNVGETSDEGEPYNNLVYNYFY